MRMRLELAIVVLALGCAGRPPPRAPAAPKVELLATEQVADGLTVRVYGTPLGKYAPGAWTFVTDGMEPELVATVAWAAGEDPAAWPRDLLPIFAALRDMAAGGTPVDLWISGEVADGLFGREDLRGIMLVPGEMPSGVPSPSGPANTLIALTADEVRVAQQFGALRVASRLGMEYRYFPTPFWIDRSRRSVFDAKHETILDGAGHAWVAGITARLVLEERLVSKGRDESGLERSEGSTAGRVVVSLTRDAGAMLASHLREAGESKRPFIALLAPDPRAEGRMTWTGAEMRVITGNADGRATALSANFVSIIPTDRPGAATLEDGLLIIVPPDGWETLLQALERGEPFRGQVSEDRSPWELEWVE